MAIGLVVWRSGNALQPINGLVLGWVTACVQVNHLVM